MATFKSKSKWNSQHIQKRCKNSHHDSLYAGWRKYSNSNHSNCFVQFCNEYQKKSYSQCNNDDDIEIIDEYDLNLYQPKTWRCTVCQFDNIERDLYCSICQSLFISNKSTKTSQCTMSDYLPSNLVNDSLHFNDDFDEAVQIAIILSYGQETKTQIQPTYIDHDPFEDNYSFPMSSKPALNGYKSVKTNNKKYCNLKNDDNAKSEIIIKTQKQWCLNKTFAAKQKKKYRQNNKIQNKKLRKDHKKCIKACPKLKRLVNKTKINCIKKEIANSYNSETRFDIKCILNWKVLCKFMGSGIGEEFKIVYHGTNHKNNQSILEKGLIVGGTKGVGIRNGTVYGRGVYCSPHTSTAKCYENGSMFICIIKKQRVKRFGSIYVVPQDSDILPIYLASFGKNKRVSTTSNKISKKNDGLNQQIIKFIPSFTALNEKNSINRKIKRKWNAYFKITQFSE